MSIINLASRYCCLLFFLLSSKLWAFPHFPIEIIVYTKPGGAIDVFARKFQKIAKKYSDDQILIKNTPGAGGLLALKKLLSKKRSDHTLAVVTKSNIGKLVSSNSAMSLSQFDWLALMVKDPEALIVRTNGEIQSFDELRSRLNKSQQMLWVGPASGGNDHIFALKLWKKLQGLGKWIPYRSGGKAMTALMGGHGEIYVGNPGDVIGKPKLKPLVISSPQRLKGRFSDIPTLGEVGVSDFDQEIMWRGFISKNTLSKEARSYFIDLLKKVSSDPEWKNYIETRGAESVFLESDEFKKQVRKDQSEFKEVINELGLNSQSKDIFLFPLILFVAFSMITFFCLYSRKLTLSLSFNRKLPRLVIWIAGYLFVIPTLGYLLTNLFFAWSLFSLFEADKKLRNFSLAFSWSLISYLLFEKLLLVSLPTGVLGWI